MRPVFLTFLLSLAAAPAGADDPSQAIGERDAFEIPDPCDGCTEAVERYQAAYDRYYTLAERRETLLGQLDRMDEIDKGYLKLLAQARQAQQDVELAVNDVSNERQAVMSSLRANQTDANRMVEQREREVVAANKRLEHTDSEEIATELQNIADAEKDLENSMIRQNGANIGVETSRGTTQADSDGIKTDIQNGQLGVGDAQARYEMGLDQMCGAGLDCSQGQDYGDMPVNPENREAAQSMLDRVIENNPDNADALSARALNNLNMGNSQAACRDANAALSINPNNERAQGISSMHCRGKLTGGMKFRDPNRRPGEDSDNLRPGTGPQLAGGPRPPGAPQGPPLAALPSIPRNLGAQRKVNPQTHFESYEKILKARSLMHQHDLPGALDHAIEALRLNPRNAQAYGLLSSIYRRAGDYRSALEAARRGLALHPKDPAMLKMAALAKGKLGDAKGAVKAARKAIAINPTDAMAYALLARALGMMGDRKGMLRALRKAAAFDPGFRGSLHQAQNSDPSAKIPFYLPGERRPHQAKQGPRRGKRKLLGMGLLALGLAAAAIMLLGRKKKQPAGEVPAAAGAAAPIAAVGVFPVGQGAPTIQAGAPTAANGLIGGKYRLGRKIGEGGMGMVFEAYDQKLDRKVAIKQMRPELKSDRRGWEQFVQEAKIVSHLSHPYIVGIHEMVEHGADTFLVFDYVDGKPLSTILAEKKRLPLNETKRIMSQVCEAIGFAHSKKVLHRDLKPANIMIDSGGYAKVMDFGIAREAKNTIARFTHKDSSGTPVYMAPEQHLGKAVQASDIFSLGVCLYEMMTGRLPYEGSDLLAQKERRAYPPPRQVAPGLPANADILIAAALEPDPAKRIADTAELSELLKDLK